MAISEKVLEPKQLNVRIDPRVHATVSAVAAIEGLSLAAWVERAMRWDLEVNRRAHTEELLRTVQGVAKIAFDPDIEVDGDSAWLGPPPPPPPDSASDPGSKSSNAAPRPKPNRSRRKT